MLRVRVKADSRAGSTSGFEPPQLHRVPYWRSIQTVEHLFCQQKVLGSNPSRGSHLCPGSSKQLRFPNSHATWKVPLNGRQLGSNPRAVSGLGVRFVYLPLLPSKATGVAAWLSARVEASSILVDGACRVGDCIGLGKRGRPVGRQTSVACRRWRRSSRATSR